MKKKELSFEDGLARLEDLAAALEDRTLSLDKALTAFEEGLALSSDLRKKLNEAAGKVEMLTKDLAGRPEAKPFPIGQFDESEGDYGQNQDDD